MNTTDATAGLKPSATPSADFVRAVSDLLDTDPADLLTELGYYERATSRRPAPAAGSPSGAAKSSR